MEGLAVLSAVLRHVLLLFFFTLFLLESTDTLSVRVMPHAIGIERAIFTRAEAYFLRLIAHAVEALGSDRFQRRK